MESVPSASDSSSVEFPGRLADGMRLEGSHGPRRRPNSFSALSRALALLGVMPTTITFSTPEARKASFSLSFSSSNSPEGRLAITLRANSPAPAEAAGGFLNPQQVAQRPGERSLKGWSLGG